MDCQTDEMLEQLPKSECFLRVDNSHDAFKVFSTKLNYVKHNILTDIELLYLS